MSLVVSRPRVVYRVYDADDFLAGGVGGEEVPAARAVSTRVRPVAVGLGSAVLALLVAVAAFGARPATRRAFHRRASGPTVSRPVPRLLPADHAAAPLAPGGRTHRIAPAAHPGRPLERARAVALSGRPAASARRRRYTVRPRADSRRREPLASVTVGAPSGAGIGVADAPRVSPDPTPPAAAPPAAAPASSPAPATPTRPTPGAASTAQFGFERGPR